MGFISLSHVVFFCEAHNTMCMHVVEVEGNGKKMTYRKHEIE